MTTIINYDPRLWGTISSWIMILVYGTNALLLYRALRSQILVQKSQQRQTDMQRYLTREKIKPRYAASVISNCKIIRENTIEIKAKAKFKLNDHEAHQVSFPHDVMMTGISNLDDKFIPREIAHQFRNTEISYDFVLKGQLDQSVNEGKRIEMQFYLLCRDDFQNEYQQKFIFNFLIDSNITVSEYNYIEEVQAYEPLLTAINGIIFNP